MKIKRIAPVFTSAAWLIALLSAWAADTTAHRRKPSFDKKPMGIRLSIKMIGPYTQRR